MEDRFSPQIQRRFSPPPRRKSNRPSCAPWWDRSRAPGARTASRSSPPRSSVCARPRYRTRPRGCPGPDSWVSRRRTFVPDPGALGLGTAPGWRGTVSRGYRSRSATWRAGAWLTNTAGYRTGTRTEAVNLCRPRGGAPATVSATRRIATRSNSRRRRRRRSRAATWHPAA